MKTELESQLQRWLDASVIDAATADRIRQLEAGEIRPRSRLATILTLSFGGLLLGAGILLFVEAHWDKMSPALRFEAVLLMVAAFHAAGAAAANRLPWLQTALHAVGTLSLGAAIYLTGQIFHLQEHWPAALMLWAAGAGCGWILLRDWPHAVLTGFLIPAWLAGEWSVITNDNWAEMRPVYEGIVGLAITYMSGVIGGLNSPSRRGVAMLGAIALFPATIAVAVREMVSGIPNAPISSRTWAWVLAIAVPLAAAILFRGGLAWINVLAVLWVLVLGALAQVG